MNSIIIKKKEHKCSCDKLICKSCQIYLENRLKLGPISDNEVLVYACGDSLESYNGFQYELIKVADENFKVVYNNKFEFIGLINNYDDKLKSNLESKIKKSKIYFFIKKKNSLWEVNNSQICENSEYQENVEEYLDCLNSWISSEL